MCISYISRSCIPQRESLKLAPTTCYFICWQALFVNSVFIVKPVIVNNVLLRVFQNIEIWPIYFVILENEIFLVLDGQNYYFSGILRCNCDFVGPFNLTIFCSKIKFYFFEFWRFYISRAASQNSKTYGEGISSIPLTSFWVMAKTISFSIPFFFCTFFPNGNKW